MVSPPSGKKPKSAAQMSDVLVTIKGKAGVFIPLPASVEDASELAGKPEKLLELLKAMKAEIARLTSENAELKRAVDAAKLPAHSADDFAGAMQHTVDTLQTRLSSLRNSVSNFAVREFRLESQVLVDVSPLGQATYRFVKPGETVRDTELSRVTLDLIPLPKQNVSGTWSPAAFTPDVSLEEIDGIGEAFRKQLNQSQLYTVGDLLQAASRVRTKVELASMLGVDRARLGTWLSQAELLTVKDIDGRKARVLVETGITSLDLLAQQQPEALAARFNEQAAKRKLKDLRVTAEQASTWVATAKLFRTGQQGGET